MSIRYKVSITMVMIFLFNIALVLGFYNIYLYPKVSSEVDLLVDKLEELIDQEITSEQETEGLIKEINARSLRNIYRDNVSRRMVLNLILFEFFVLFFLLIIVGITSLLFLVKPLNKLVNGMEGYSRGVIPKISIHGKDEIGRLQKQFVKLIDSIEVEKSKQSQIIASISHDIKTPLTAIMGYSERLLKNDYTKEKQARYLETIYSKSQHINELINEFDEYISYNFEGSLSIKYLSVEYICDSIKAEYFDELFDAGVSFSVINNCADEKVYVDIAKFKRVIGNLIGNSIKHTGETKTFVFVASPSPSLSCVEFIFIDNGSGVAKEEIPFIFDPLYTSDKSRKVAGLGLSICKNIITAHGGTISARNGENGGLEIISRIPISSR